jgi:hypothetical protein
LKSGATSERLALNTGPPSIPVVKRREKLKMLVIKVELWPGGDEQFKSVLARAGIGNVSNLADVSDYEVVANETENRLAGTPAWKSRGLLPQHDRRQSVWTLVAKAAAWAASEAEKHAR